MSESQFNSEEQVNFTTGQPPQNETPRTPVELSLNKDIFEQQLNFQINACNPGEGQLHFCFGLPFTSPITLERLTQAKESLVTQFNPNRIDIIYHDPKLTSKAEGYIRLINKIYDFALQNLFHQGVALTTNIAAAYEASLVTKHTAETATQSTSTPVKENLALTEEQKVALLNRSKNINELKRLIDSFGGLNWGSTINSGDNIYNLFSSLIQQIRPTEDSLLVFPPIIREKIKEFYYQSKIESANNQARLEQIVLSIGSFKINDKIYSAQDILFRLRQANFATDPVLDYYGLKSTFSKIRAAQHDHYSDKPNTYFTVAGEKKVIPPEWGN